MSKSYVFTIYHYPWTELPGSRLKLLRRCSVVGPRAIRTVERAIAGIDASAELADAIRASRVVRNFVEGRSGLMDSVGLTHIVDVEGDLSHTRICVGPVDEVLVIDEVLP